MNIPSFVYSMLISCGRKKIKKISLSFLIFAIIFCSVTAFSETIELKNGKTIVGTIKHETEDVVVVSKLGGDFVYSLSRDMIKSIRESTPEEMEHNRQQEQAAYVPDKEKTIKKKKEPSKYRMEQYEKEVASARKARTASNIEFWQGRFGIVEAIINGKVSAKLRIDTGADLVLISEDIVRGLGVTEEIPKSGRLRLVLADGKVVRGIPMVLKSVEIGNSKIDSVSAAIIPDATYGTTDGLLGMSYLQHFNVKLDAQENTLILERK